MKKKDVQFVMLLEKELHEKLKLITEKEYCSMGQVVRKFIRDYKLDK